jgi:hypothetical protein
MKRLLVVSLIVFCSSCTINKTSTEISKKLNFIGGKGGDGGKAENGKDGESGKDGKDRVINIEVKHKD